MTKNYIYCVINEFNPTFEVQQIGNEAFQNAWFGKTSFPNGTQGLQLPLGCDSIKIGQKVHLQNGVE